MRTDQEEQPGQYSGSLDEFVECVSGEPEREELLSALVETVSAVCSPTLVAVWAFDEDTAGLTPQEYVSVSDFENPEEVVKATEDFALDAYSKGSAHTTQTTEDAFPDGLSSSVSIETCLSDRIGEHGVLVAFLPPDSRLTEVDRSVVSVAASMANFSLEVSEQRKTAEDREEQLEEYKETTEKLERLLDMIRKTSRELLRATTRTEIEQAVCRQLVSSPFVEFAWMGKYVESGDEMVPEYSTDDEYLRRLEDNGGTKMAKEVARSREPTLVGDLRGDPPLEPWREQALRYGFRSVMRVPILHKSSMYGVLTVYSETTVEDDDHVWSAVKDIGNLVGHTINTYETKTALVSDEVTEVRFRVRDPAFPAVRFASEVGGSVTFENAATRRDGPHRVYVSVVSEVGDEEGEERRARIEEVAERTPLIESYRHVTTRDNAEVYSIVGDISFFRQVLDRSGTLLEMNATGDGAELLVELPKYASVKSFVSMVEGEYDSVEVLSTRSKEREFRTESGFKGKLKEELTDRQLETLQTAYYSGYFDSPRESTGQDIAEQLGVTQPTVTENIKAGQRKLLSMLFDE